MGVDKARIAHGGQTLLEKTALIAQQVAGSVWLACGSEQRYSELGYELVLDQVPDGGPLEGLRVGLEKLEGDWLLAVACDMPALSVELFGPLLVAAGEPGVDLVHYRGEDGDEPLCALYRRTVLPAVSSSLNAGRHRMDGFWSGLGSHGQALVVRTLPKPSIGTADANPFLNVNTPEDLARSSWAPGAGEVQA